jgi:hypothetical protein
MRRLAADADGADYHAFGSLDDARAEEHGVVVLEGDDGGQIYATCPARHVACSEPELRQLLDDLDRLVWRDPDAARVVFERVPPGSAVAGGMGGGVVRAGVWVHEELVRLGLEPEIRDVIEGRRARVSERRIGR